MPAGQTLAVTKTLPLTTMGLDWLWSGAVLAPAGQRGLPQDVLARLRVPVQGQALLGGLALPGRAAPAGPVGRRSRPGRRRSKKRREISASRRLLVDSRGRPEENV